MKNYVPGFSEELLYFGRQGKPFLKNGVQFNISHGGNYIVLAVSCDCDGVGVDVEPIREMDYYRNILPYAMSEGERRFVGSDAKRAACILTRKESLFKCLGEGVEDPGDMPDVISDTVPFAGHIIRLDSTGSDAHIFSVAWRKAGTDDIQKIRNFTVFI